MGRNILPVLDKAKQRVDKKADEDQRPPWPQIGEYKENGVTIRVFKSAWLKGAVMDYRTRLPRKGKN